MPQHDDELIGQTGTSRRTILKVIAGAPLMCTFGLALSPLMRFLKPSMAPLNFLQPADAPVADDVQFDASWFPSAWTCLEFVLDVRRVEFNPEGYVRQKIPCFIIRTPEEYVAFIRLCRGCGGKLRYVHQSSDVDCGCSPGSTCCCVADFPNNPALFCPNDESIFDPRQKGKPVHGRSMRRGLWLHQLEVGMSDNIVRVRAPDLIHIYGIV